MVVHGGVDGYSRAVVFLRCANNNEDADGNYGIYSYKETVNIIQHFESDTNWSRLETSVHGIN